jgi:hypothetical protein
LASDAEIILTKKCCKYCGKHIASMGFSPPVNPDEFADQFKPSIRRPEAGSNRQA